MFTTNDSAYCAAIDLAESGVDIALIADARPEAPARLATECAARGIEVRAGQLVTGTEGTRRVTAVHVGGEKIECDTLLVSGGWNPVVSLFSQARGKLRYDAELGAFVPGEELSTAAVRVAKELTGLDVEPGVEVMTVRHGVTRFRITLACVEAGVTGGKFAPGFYAAAKWVTPAELADYPVSAPQRVLMTELANPHRQKRLF